MNILLDFGIFLKYMAHILINDKREISVYEFKTDRAESCCVCKYDIITLPENIFSTAFVEKLKRGKAPIDLTEIKNILP